MINKPTISIIVPVYNVETFITQCLNSLLAQTFKNIEILCINDGSTDKSAMILNKFALKDNRIRIFHQKNLGPAAARNKGLAEAKGRYLMFCDADDSYKKNMCELMYHAITCNRVDFAICDANVIEYDADHGRNKYVIEYHRLKYIGKNKLTNSLKPNINVLLWNKIFKLSIIRKQCISFPTGYEYDDNSFIWQYFCFSKNFYGLNKKLYNYKLLNNSIMGKIYNKKHISKIFDRIYATEFTLKFLYNKKLLKNNLWLLQVIENGVLHAFRHLSYKNRIKFLKLTKEKLLHFYKYEELQNLKQIKHMYITKHMYINYFFAKKNTNSSKAISITKINIKYQTHRLLSHITFGKIHKKQKTSAQNYKQMLLDKKK